MGYKAGYEGEDSMRSKAAKMMGGVERESLKVKASKSAADNDKPRPYKKGGSVGVSTGSNAELSRSSRDSYPMPKKAAPARDFKKGGMAAKKKVSSALENGTKHSKPVAGKRLVEKDGFAGGEKARNVFAKAMAGGGSARLNIEKMSEVPKKKGGAVKCMAMGGVGKIRKDEMTPAGKIVKQAKKPRKNGM